MRKIILLLVIALAFCGAAYGDEIIFFTQLPRAMVTEDTIGYKTRRNVVDKTTPRGFSKGTRVKIIAFQRFGDEGYFWVDAGKLYVIPAAHISGFRR
jgi:hypothetical protein